MSFGRRAHSTMESLFFLQAPIMGERKMEHAFGSGTFTGRASFLCTFHTGLERAMQGDFSRLPCGMEELHLGCSQWACWCGSLPFWLHHIFLTMDGAASEQGWILHPGSFTFRPDFCERNCLLPILKNYVIVHSSYAQLLMPSSCSLPRVGELDKDMQSLYRLG